MAAEAIQPQIPPEKAFKESFCVAIPTAGSPIKLQNASPTEFLSTADKSMINWIDCTADDIFKDANGYATTLGFEQSLVPGLISSLVGPYAAYAAYEDLTKNLGLMLTAITSVKKQVEVSPIIILVRKNLILTIHDSKTMHLKRFARYADIFMRKLPNEDRLWQDRNTIVIHRIIEEICDKNFEKLRTIAERAEEFEEQLVEYRAAEREEINRQIFRLKRNLLIFLRTLWATRDVVHSLKYGDAELITDDTKLLERFTIVSDDLARQISLTENIMELLTDGITMLSTLAQSELQVLSNKMMAITAWLTVVATVILVPNTIATFFGIYTPPWPLIWIIVLLLISGIISGWISWLWIKRIK